jgi:hypothetical protein
MNLGVKKKPNPATVKKDAAACQTGETANRSTVYHYPIIALGLYFIVRGKRWKQRRGGM